MITIYAPDATDFSTLGLGALAPYECEIEEQAGGMYELTMTHPMDEAGKWLNIGVGCIVKAPAPVRETPLVESEIVGEGEVAEPVTVTRKIYKVQTNTGANLHLRQGPSTSTAILSKYRPGTEVVALSQANGWGQVIVCSSGATGYMSMQYLVYVRDETETIEGDAPGPERVVYPVQSRMQLFRIFKVERDAAEREVRVTARHIFYDLLGNVIKNEYAPEGEAADVVVEELFERALNPHDFSVHCQTARSVTGEYTRRGLVECLLDPDDGVLPQTGARLVRDNFDVWLLPDATRETGVTIRHGKNLLGATLTTDWEDLTTRIIPVGQNSDGKPLLLTGTIYVDSPRIDDYPVIRAQAVEYDVKVGQDGINNDSQARTKLTELAEADFSDNGVDLPTVGLDVDFVALGETEEYRQYADLEAVHLYDTVRVIAKSAGIDAAVRVTGYKWDALGRKYEAVTLGEIADLKTTVYGYELQRGSVKTIKIAPGAVNSAQLRELAVQYAHINTAAVEQLSANSITALKAYITEIVAGSITTDELYAGIASIALAQITTANIENANIDWAQIGTLSADIATIAKAHLTDADIDWANIANLTAAVAEIAQVEIGEAVIDGAQITDGTITNAKIENAAIDTAKIALGAITTALIATGAVGTAQIADGSITDAKIVSLNADVINAGTLSVDRLLLKGPDGLFVAINATDEGLTSEQLSQDEYQSAISGSVLVARSVTADKIAAKSITANEIAAGAITTAELAAESVDASKIKAGSITTSHVAANFGETLDISSNEQVEIIAGNVQQAQETADSAQEVAEQATPLTGAEPPEEAPAAGKLWIDEGQTPSVWRRWRGADVPTDREYDKTISGDADSPAFVSIDNAQGQLQTVALEAGCVAQQAGAGDPSPSNIRAISGRESVEVQACGKNLLNPPGDKTISGLTYTLQSDGTYLVNGTITGISELDLYEGILPIGQYTVSGGTDGMQVALAVYKSDGTYIRVICTSTYGAPATGTVTALTGDESYHRTFIQSPATIGLTLTNIAISPQLERGDTATAFEPYRPMGGGTVTPTEPLYGLTGAEDTVDVDASGDVTVTRRTAVVELDGTESVYASNTDTDGVVRYSFGNNLLSGAAVPTTNSIAFVGVCSHYLVRSADDTYLKRQGASINSSGKFMIYDPNFANETDAAAFKAYLAAQKAAGTPVTIVYELAAPETEALTAISPITPEAGPVNIWTDADALTATVRGSGWEIINDTDGLSEGIDGLLDNVGSLTGALDSTQAQLTDLAAVTITRDEVESIVTSVDGRLSSMEQQAGSLDVVVAEMRGDVDNIMLGVHVGTGGVGIYRDGDPYRINIDNRGMTVTEGGMETLSARESQVNANRMQVREALMLGSELALVVSPGKLRLQRR